VLQKMLDGEKGSVGGADPHPNGEGDALFGGVRERKGCESLFLKSAHQEKTKEKDRSRWHLSDVANVRSSTPSEKAWLPRSGGEGRTCGEGEEGQPGSRKARSGEKGKRLPQDYIQVAEGKKGGPVRRKSAQVPGHSRK